MGASGRSQLLTSTASTMRPSAALGSGSPASVRRNRVGSSQPGVQGGVQGVVPAPVLDRQRQFDQGFHRPVRAQHRVGELEECVRAEIRQS
ncbi:hypothetical protein SHIRM173S_07649 [Streptomyces hirsutus]